MEDFLKKEITNIREQKKINKKFYQSLEFYKIYNSIKHISKPILVNDPLVILWINSILETNRKSIFFESFYRYSVQFEELIVEKFYKEKMMYVIHPKLNYLFP